jgi:hypothetical protein
MRQELGVRATLPNPPPRAGEGVDRVGLAVVGQTPCHFLGKRRIFLAKSRILSAKQRIGSPPGICYDSAEHLL